MNISLPDDLRDWVEEEVASDGGYTSTSEYIRELIRRERDRSRLRRLVQEGLDSPSRVVDVDEYISELRADFGLGGA